MKHASQKLKSPSGVSSSQISSQSSYLSSVPIPFLDRCSCREGTNHSGWICSTCCTTRRLYNRRHSGQSACHYHDPWWKMPYHDEEQENPQQCLKKIIRCELVSLELNKLVEILTETLYIVFFFNLVDNISFCFHRAISRFTLSLILLSY